MATPAEITRATRAKYEPVIGLEVHVHLLTASKIFCSCSTRFGDPPNTNVCPVCLGLPGALPVLNKKAVEFATLAAMALNCRINERSIFARKNYFYPDLPKGFQVSQYDRPLAEFGYIEVPASGGGTKKIGITRVHLEEDAGKSLHEGFPDSYERTYLDLNRCGVPLIEIVSEPDIRSPEEAHEYLTRLKEIILYTGVSDVNMEEGSLRCDANISVRPAGQEQFGTKTEIKNVNSFRFIRQALEYEIGRHITVIESGGRILQETRLFNSNEGKTYSMRSKEEAHDYRYFPEPDLLPLVVDAAWQQQIRAALPELPEARRRRMIQDYGLTEDDAHTLTRTQRMADQFESAARAARNPKRVANLVISDLLGRLKAQGLEIEQSPISMQGVAMSADLVESGAISGKILKDLYDKAFERKQDFPAIYEQEKPQQITDTAAIEKMIDDVLAASPRQVEQYRAGKTTMKGFFVGQVMKMSKGTANPALVNELLEGKLTAKPKLQDLYVPPRIDENRIPIFANENFWQEFKADFANFLRVLPNLEDALSSVIDRAHESLSVSQHVTFHLVTLCGISMTELLLLAANGRGRGAMKIARNMLESAVNAEYVRVFPEVTDDYVDWIWVEQHRILEYVKQNSPDEYGSLDKQVRRTNEENFNRVLSKFQYVNQDGKLELQKSWTRLNLEQRAQKTNFHLEYRLIYPIASQILHGTMTGLGTYHEPAKDVHRLIGDPSKEWVAQALIGGHLCLLRAIDTVCKALRVDPNPSQRQLEGDFHFAWTDPREASREAVLRLISAFKTE